MQPQPTCLCRATAKSSSSSTSRLPSSRAMRLACSSVLGYVLRHQRRTEARVRCTPMRARVESAMRFAASGPRRDHHGRMSLRHTASPGLSADTKSPEPAPEALGCEFLASAQRWVPHPDATVGWPAAEDASTSFHSCFFLCFAPLVLPEGAGRKIDTHTHTSCCVASQGPVHPFPHSLCGKPKQPTPYPCRRRATSGGEKLHVPSTWWRPGCGRCCVGVASDSEYIVCHPGDARSVRVTRTYPTRPSHCPLVCGA